MPSFTSIMLVGLGGFLGSVARYIVSGLVVTWLKDPWFPYGTLAVNVVGCLLIGVLAGLADTRDILSTEVRLLLVVGILGGFTTFSAFGNETMALVRNGAFIGALTNVALQVVLGLLAVWIGYAVSHAL